MAMDILVMWNCEYWLSSIGVFYYPKKIGLKSSGKFDFWGSLFGVSGLVLINFAFNQGPNIGWHVPYVYVLLIVGFLCIVAFHFVEERVEDPLVPKRGLTGRHWIYF